MFTTMRSLPYRIILMLVNIFFPPMAVMMVTGLGADTAMNCLLFLLAVIPSHVHGFYITWVYFSRRRRVKKGLYPGGPKSMIASKNVVNGGLSDAEVARLYRGGNGSDGKGKVRSRSMSRGREEREMAQRHGSRAGRKESQRRGASRGGEQQDNDRTRRWARAQQVAQDGYGPVMVPGSSAATSSVGRW